MLTISVRFAGFAPTATEGKIASSVSIWRRCDNVSSNRWGPKHSKEVFVDCVRMEAAKSAFRMQAPTCGILQVPQGVHRLVRGAHADA